MVASGDNVYIHHGRGGAGNVTNASAVDKRRPSRSADEQSHRRGFSGRRFSTGVGGSGNMSSQSKVRQSQQSEADETGRLLHDMQTPGIVLLEDSFHTGRGGAANKYKPSDEEIQEARENNENVRRQSLASLTQRRESLATLNQGESPSSSWSSRRMSVVDSVKDILQGRRASKA
ncbi:hypothetical protein PV11_09569 [Exophiala sideris]|uniref:Uncharacterized protein n=1 Tax=Exophiala sideris TaxID=1016849 RepID=A0A0D1YAC2_9EURO|nr:hypothetical protein PV11_09569 [Exophiala sideris]